MKITNADKERLSHFLGNQIDRIEALIADGFGDDSDAKDLETIKRVVTELDKELANKKPVQMILTVKQHNLINQNIRMGAGLLLNCYYDGAITEPKPLKEWVKYVYHEVTTNFVPEPGVIEMGNKVLRFIGAKDLKRLILDFLVTDSECKKYIKECIK